MNDFNLDDAVLKFGKGTDMSEFSIRAAVEGLAIFGGIGSGKTHGSGRAIALNFLKMGFGGLVLTAKIDEKALWVDYCEQTGRRKDLIIIEPGSDHFFNFLEYESKQIDGQVSYTDNLVHLLKTVIRSADEKDKGKSNDGFWDDALEMLMSNTINLCQLAFGKVTVRDMYQIVKGAPSENSTPKGSPQYNKAYNAAALNVSNQIGEWKKKQPEHIVEAMDHNDDFEPVKNDCPDVRSFDLTTEFFEETYRMLSEKTRSIVDFSFLGFLFRLMQEPIYSLFCKNTSTFVPENCLYGKIILLNIPVKRFHKVGRDCQILFKYIWQRSMEKRDVNENNRPVFLWADEAQNFLHEHDSDYQATARASIISTVYISQNLPNYHANMAGGKSDYKVKSFLGTLGTKIFHANADIETNQYASALIGEAYTDDVSTTRNSNQVFNNGSTTSYKLEKMVRPEEFVALKTGGPKNKNIVQGFIHKQGTPFPNGWNHRLANFDQNYLTDPTI